MSRKTARVNAFQIVFQIDFHGISELEKVLEIFYSTNSINLKDEKYITDVVRGTVENLEQIDSLIETSSNKWSGDRMSKVDMAIMRVGAFEMLKMEDVPHGVSINEAVELAKSFGTDESPAFVNGILGAISKNIENEKTSI